MNAAGHPQVQALAALYKPPERQSPPVRAGQSKGAAFGDGLRPDSTTRRYHVDHASADVLLHRLDGVQRAGTGWRARCPACEGRSRKLSIAESDGRVLIHCFGGCAAADVLAAVGLRWSDLRPPRHWPQSPEERRRARRALQQAGWAAALGVLALESRIVLLAARELWAVGGLGSVEDGKRLAQAVERIAGAASVLIEGAREVRP